MASDGVEKGWFLAMRYRSSKTWTQRVAELPRRVRAAAIAPERDLRFRLVDASRKQSASKL
jgi:hypothetical protein